MSGSASVAPAQPLADRWTMVALVPLAALDQTGKEGRASPPELSVAARFSLSTYMRLALSRVMIRGVRGVTAVTQEPSSVTTFDPAEERLVTGVRPALIAEARIDPRAFGAILGHPDIDPSSFRLSDVRSVQDLSLIHI